MKKYAAVLMSILLLTFGFAMNSQEISAEPKKEKDEPKIKKMKMKTKDEAAGDLSHPPDGIDDIYLKIKNPGTSNKVIKVDIKITDLCVDGINHDDAAMKMAFSTEGFFHPSLLVDEGFTITNNWFKKEKNDENKQIDPFTDFTTFFKLPDTGDDLIQKNPTKKNGSMKYNKNGINQLGGQSGWEGSFEFKGNPGDYDMNFWLPLTSPTSAGDSCNIFNPVSVPITIGP